MKKLILNLLIILYGKISFQTMRKIIFRTINRLDINGENLNYIMKKYHNIKIGNYSYGCHKTDGTIEPGTEIGKYCSIAPGVRIED